MSDSVLVAAKSGSVEAVNQLIGLVQDYVFTVAKSFLGKNHSAAVDVEDLMQDALLAIITDLSQCQAETYEGFLGWASYVVRNRVYNSVKRLKTQKRGGRAKVVSIDDEYIPDDAVLVSEDRSEEDREQLDILFQLANGQKSERVRSVALLFMEGLSYDEIAERLSCTKFAAHAAMKRFRREARELIG